ncbi:MAG: hypothetical protein RSD57_04575 [Comamonas sp.]
MHHYTRLRSLPLQPRLLALALALPFAAQAGEVTFNTVGAAEWQVPAGVESIQIVATGGGGGGGGHTAKIGAGGAGGKVNATWPVTPGSMLQLFVGGGGAAAKAPKNQNKKVTSGSGGGASTARLGKLLLVAGGGGGAAITTNQPVSGGYGCAQDGFNGALKNKAGNGGGGKGGSKGIGGKGGIKSKHDATDPDMNPGGDGKGGEGGEGGLGAWASAGAGDGPSEGGHGGVGGFLGVIGDDYGGSGGGGGGGGYGGGGGGASGSSFDGGGGGGGWFGDECVSADNGGRPIFMKQDVTDPTNKLAATSNGGAGSIVISYDDPAPISATLGGSINGLSTAGLVLVSGGNPLQTVAPAAKATSFAFADAVAGPYAVAVQTQPSGLQCTVDSGTGTITADVTNVVVSCVPTASAAPTPVPSLGALGVLMLSGLLGWLGMRRRS